MGYDTYRESEETADEREGWGSAEARHHRPNQQQRSCNTKCNHIRPTTTNTIAKLTLLQTTSHRLFCTDASKFINSINNNVLHSADLNDNYQGEIKSINKDIAIQFQRDLNYLKIHFQKIE